MPRFNLCRSGRASAAGAGRVRKALPSEPHHEAESQIEATNVELLDAVRDHDRKLVADDARAERDLWTARRDGAAPVVATVQRRARMSLYQVLERANFRGIARGLYRVRITGSERIPTGSGVILVANHESLFDPWLLALATPREVRYMAKAELWKLPLVGRALDAFGAFPVERGTGDGSAMSRAASLLRDGEVLGIFPQGTSKQLPHRVFHRGAARLALVTGAPIVPVRLVGTRGFPRPGRRPVEVHVGEPLVVEPAKPTVALARALTAQLEHAVAQHR